MGRAAGYRGPAPAEGHAGVERHGPVVEAHEARDGGESGDQDGRDVGTRRVPVHHRPEPARSAAAGWSALGQLLADKIAGLSKNFLQPTYVADADNSRIDRFDPSNFAASFES